MIGAEWLRLPNLPEGTPEEQLRAIRNYLFQLSEQLQYAFSHTEEQEIDGAAIREAVLGSGELVGTLAAMAGKRLEERYIGTDSWEADRRRGAVQWAEALCRLAALEDCLPKPETAETPVLCRGETMGYQVQEGEQVRFTCLPAPQELLKQQPDGHWRTE